MTYRHSLLLVVLFGAAATTAFDTACSSSFEPKSCQLDSDCGPGLACVASDGKSICISAKDAPIVIGQSAPASGPSQDLGLEMKRGIELAFEAQNAAGGIRGRPLSLDFLDDQYTPDIAESNARTLVDVVVGTTPPRCPTTTTPPVAGQNPFSQTALLPGPKAVLAVIGSVGTPTMVRAAPVIVETGTLYFGAFTGATAMLRDDKAGPCKKYIFNVRASYAQEARATLEYFLALGMPDDSHLLSFDQNDTFGDAGYNGLVAAYTAVKNTTPNIKRFRYTRDDVNSVPAQATAAIGALTTLLQTPGKHTVGILMTDTYGPGSSFIKLMKDWLYAADAQQTATDRAHRLTLLFSNVSFVGPNSLAGRLRDLGTVNTSDGPKPYTENVFVSQVVPNYERDNSDAVLDYRRLITPTGAPPTYTSFEGYIAGRIFIEGLKNNPGAFSSDNLVSSFEGLTQLNIGLGGFSGFSPDIHQASKSVWGTTINSDGSFGDKYFWTDGSKIQLAE
jgi:ABC-type branched-subunit amino acid transport system substrate-binding protein